VKAKTRRDLKHDKLADSLLWIGAKANEYRKPIILAVVVAAVAAGIAVWVMTERERTRTVARARLAKARLQVQHTLAETGAKRDEAAKKALALLDAVAADYPDTPAAPLAFLEAAQLLVALEQPKDAIPYFEKVLAAAAKQGADRLIPLAKRGLAETQEAAGNIEVAMDYYRDLQQQYGDSQRIQASWDLGRCYELTSRPAEAENLYRQCRDLGKGTIWAALAHSRIQRLADGKKPTVAPPAPADPAKQAGGKP